jgi:hypothetical protein
MLLNVNLLAVGEARLQLLSKNRGGSKPTHQLQSALRALISAALVGENAASDILEAPPMALRPSISGSNAVPFVIRERCLLERRSTGAGSADELGAAFLACFGGSVATRHIAPDLPGMRADAVMNVSLFSSY